MTNLVAYSYNNGTAWTVRWNGRGVLTREMENMLVNPPSFTSKEEAEAWIKNFIA